MNFYLSDSLIGKSVAFIIIPLIVTVCWGGAQTANAQAAPGDSIDIQDAIRLALKNQPRLAELQARLKAAEAQVGQAKSKRYPQAAVQGHFTHIHPVSSFQLGENEPPENIEPPNSIDGHLAVHQLIYDFGRTEANIALARSKTLTARQRMKVKKWTISYFTVKTYSSILYLQKRVNVEKKQIKTLRQDLKLAKQRLHNGSATRYDVLSTQVRIAEENNNRLDLAGQKNKMIIQLRNLFGWAPNRPVQLSDSLALKRRTPAINPNQVRYDSRPDYQVLNRRKKEAEQRLKVNATLNNPSLSAGGTAGYKNGFIKDINRPFANYSIGLQIQIPLFNGFRTQFKKQEAQASIQNAQAQKRQLQRTIDTQVRQAYTDVETGLKKIKTADLQIKQASQQLQLAKLRYRKGVITNTDLLTSETALARARLQKVAAQYNILLNQYALEKAAGHNIWSGPLSRQP